MLYMIQNIDNIWEYTISKCELGPVTTFLIVIAFPAMNCFVRLFDSLLHFIVLKKMNSTAVYVYGFLIWIKSVGPTCILFPYQLAS